MRLDRRKLNYSGSTNQDPSQHYHVILMDLHMPRMDGFICTRLIREIPAYAHTPIVALTAASRRVEFAKAMASGLDAFLQKPMRIEVLTKLLRSRGVLHKSDEVCSKPHTAANLMSAR